MGCGLGASGRYERTNFLVFLAGPRKPQVRLLKFSLSIKPPCRVEEGKQLRIWSPMFWEQSHVCHLLNRLPQPQFLIYKIGIIVWLACLPVLWISAEVTDVRKYITLLSLLHSRLVEF